MDRPTKNDDQGLLTDEEYRILSEADEKMKKRKPERSGWYWFMPMDGSEYEPRKIYKDSTGTLMVMPSVPSFPPYKVSETFKCQWGGRIEEPK